MIKKLLILLFTFNALIAYSQNGTKVIIKEIRINNVPIEDMNSPELLDGFSEREITLDFRKQNDFAIFWDTSHSKSGDKYAFQYLLEGFDDTWITAGDMKSARFVNLEKGNYIFKLIYSVNGVLQIDQGIILKIKIE